MIEIKNLKAGYDHHTVLKGISLQIQEGDLGVVIGPNGSGKSTTIKSIFGLTTRYAGTILFEKTDITTMKTHRIVRRGIGYVPQGRLVFDSLSVEENLEMGGFGLDRTEIAKRKREVLDLFPALKQKLAQKASFLSGGQQQMLSIGRALMRRPKLLLLDEPSLGLDPKTQKLIFSILKKINTTGVTILMVEQNAYQALQICTKAFVIENGMIAARGGRELARKKKIKEHYLGG